MSHLKTFAFTFMFTFRTVQKTFSIFISHFREKKRKKVKRIYLHFIDSLFFQQPTPQAHVTIELFLFFMPQKHACHSIQLNFDAKYPLSFSSLPACFTHINLALKHMSSTQNEEEKFYFLFLLFTRVLWNDLWDLLQLIIKVSCSFFMQWWWWERWKDGREEKKKKGKLQIFRMITYWIFKPHLKHINFNDCLKEVSESDRERERKRKVEKKKENLINQNDVGKTCVRDRMSEKLWENMWQHQRANTNCKKLLKRNGWCAPRQHTVFHSNASHKSNSIVTQTYAIPSSIPHFFIPRFKIAGKFT